MTREQLEASWTRRFQEDAEFRAEVERDPRGVLARERPGLPEYATLEMKDGGVRILVPPAPGLDPKPTFFEPQEFAFLEKLRARFPAMQEEARRVIGWMRELDWLYPHLFRRDSLLERGNRGRFMLWFVGMRLGVNQRLCPAAAEACWGIPGLISAGFYLLGPRTRMLSHVGTRSDILRGHLGMVVPEGCALRVGPDTRAWAEGEFLIFDDTHPHEAWNESDEYRCVFHFDFLPAASDVDRAAAARALRSRLLASAPGYLPWLLAAEVQTDGDHLELLSRGEGESAKAARTLAQHHGVFL